MTQTSEDSGGGIAPIGTAGSVCAISPSDLVGTVDNIIGRIEKIEQVLMQIATGNIWANQLSDLSQQVGWLTGVTYMGIPGWTQTEYGTLIPPPGFTLLGNGITLSDGNTYQAVVMDENGVLQFGFTPGGTAAGELVDTWNGGGTTDYYKMSLVPTISESSGITQLLNLFDPLTNGVYTGNLTVEVSRAGVYLVHAYCDYFDPFGGEPAGTLVAQGNIQSSITTHPRAMRGFQVQSSSTLGVTTPTADIARYDQTAVLLVDANGRISVQMDLLIFGGSISATTRFGSVDVSIVRLGGL